MTEVQLQAFKGPSVYGDTPMVRIGVEAIGPDEIDCVFLIETVSTLIPRLTVSERPVKDQLLERIGERTSIGWAEAIGILAVVLQDDLFGDPLRSFLPEKRYTELVEICVETNVTESALKAATFACMIVLILVKNQSSALTPSARTQLENAQADYQNGMRHVDLNTQSRLVVQAARLRGIPYFLPEPPHYHVELGHGTYRTRLYSAMADSTSAVAAALISRDKWNTARALEAAALPVPKHILVRSEDEAFAAAERIGAPVVVKGRTGDKGESVSTDIKTKSDLRAAIAKVPAQNRPILVEKFIQGDDYRITVVNGRAVGAVRRLPARIVGDGQATIRTLIERENDRRRTLGPFAFLLKALVIDDGSTALLEKQSLTPDSIPEKDQTVVLQGAQNVALGALLEDVTDIIHPEICDVAARAARIVGLDIAGVDIISPNMSKPLSETGGVILEVNEFPGIHAHYIADGKRRETALDIIDYLFKDKNQGRIPTVAVTGTNGKTTVTLLVERMLQNAGLFVGASTTNGVTIGGRTVGTGDYASGTFAKTILRDPRVEAGVFEMARGALIREGVTWDTCSVSVVTNVTEDHLGRDRVNTVDEMARVKRVIAERAREAVILNADDPRCVAMTDHIDVPIWWVTRRIEDERVLRHLQAGGNAIVIAGEDEAQQILWCRVAQTTPVIRVKHIPATYDGRLQVNVENAAMATAAALALKQDLAPIQKTLREFETTADMTLGRFNMRDAGGITIVSDYAHNTVGLNHACAFLSTFNVKGRRLCYFGTRGRSDVTGVFDDIMGIIAAHFDLFYLGEPRHHPDEPIGLIQNQLSAALAKAGVKADAIRTMTDERDGVAATLGEAKPGDLVVLFTQHHAETWKQVSAFKPDQGRFDKPSPSV